MKLKQTQQELSDKKQTGLVTEEWAEENKHNDGKEETVLGR